VSKWVTSARSLGIGLLGELIMASLNDKLIAAGGTIATIGASLLSVGLAENSGSRMTVWRNSWFEGGIAFLVIPLLLLASATVVWLVGRASQGPAGGLFPGNQPVGLPKQRFIFQGGTKPLRIQLMDEKWLLHNDIQWYFGLMLRISNSTDRKVILADFRLLRLSLIRKKISIRGPTQIAKYSSDGCRILTVGLP
jgi:hypothetical protein